MINLLKISFFTFSFIFVSHVCFSNEPVNTFKKKENFDINVGDEDLSKTALMWAAQHGYIESVKLLVENGANLNQQT